MASTDSSVAFRVKHYRLKGVSEEGDPALIFQINVQLQDVRSGYRDSVYEFFKVTWLAEKDLNWTKEMVWRIDQECLQEIDPPSEFTWPEFSDERMIRYLVQHNRPRIWRNYALGMYSCQGETRAEFVGRCQERLLEERSGELKKFRDVFVRRFLELEQRLIEEITQGEWNEDRRHRQLARIGDLFTSIREDLSRWSVHGDLQAPRHMELPRAAEIDPAVQDKLDDLREDLVSTYNQINGEYEQRANQIERYEVPVTYPQIEIVSRGIVWHSVC